MGRRLWPVASGEPWPAGKRRRLITPDLPFDLVHVGKCGGTSAATELRGRGFRFDHVHMRRPTYGADRRYVVLVRDPVARFVSAFNWRRHLIAEGSLAAPEDPVGRLRHEAERSLLACFADVGSFAEALVPKLGYDVSPPVTMMQVIGHVPQGFAWYLDGLLRRIEPGQLLGVVAMERFAADIERLFGFTPVARRNAHAGSVTEPLSPLGLANLTRVLAPEYETLAELATIARRAGTPMSVEYSPAS